jgi:hypothetical protein
MPCGDCDVVFYVLLGSTGYIDLVPFFACARGFDLAGNRTQSRAHLLSGAPLARGDTLSMNKPVVTSVGDPIRLQTQACFLATSHEFGFGYASW